MTMMTTPSRSDGARPNVWPQVRVQLAMLRLRLQHPHPSVIAEVVAQVVPIETSPGVRAEVAEAVSAASRSLASVLFDLGGDRVPVVDGMFAPDAALALICEELGPGGQEYAEQLRNQAAERWREYESSTELSAVWEMLPLWDDDVLPTALARVARFVWRDRIRPQLKQPAVAMVVFERVTRALHAPAGAIDIRPNGSLVRMGTVVASASLPADIVSGLVAAARSLAAHRLLRWVVDRVHAQHAGGRTDFRTVTVVGGYQALAAELRREGEAQPQHPVRKALDAFQGLHLTFPGGHAGGLIQYTFHRGARGRPSLLRIVVGDPLLPGFVNSLPGRGGKQSAGRWLVPVPTRLPPLPAGERNHAGAAALQLLVLAEFRRQLSTLMRNGSIAVDWAVLAKAVGLNTRARDEVVDLWLGPRAGDFLQPVAGRRVTLAPPYRGERQLLEEAWEQSQANRARARKRRRR